MSAPARVAIVGLGRIFDLNVLAYTDRGLAEVVALVDPNPARLAERGAAFPEARRFADLDALLDAGVEVDVAEVLVPIAAHADVASALLRRGIDVNLQKPMCVTLAEADELLGAAAEGGAVLRVMDNYLFYEPLARLRDLVASAELGEVTGYHFKMVGTGLGGWDVPFESFERQFELAARGRGILLFDDGWHKLSLMLWLFGPIEEVRAWIGETEVAPGLVVDAPSTVLVEHTSGVRGTFDATLAVDLLMPSSYYASDERFEVTFRRGFARVNRCTARGLQQPSFEVYADGVLQSFHALDDDWASSFVASGRHFLEWRERRHGPLRGSAEEATDVLRLALAIVASDAAGGRGVHPAEVRDVLQS